MGIQDEIRMRAIATGRLSPSQMDTAVQRRNELQDRLAEVRMMQDAEKKRATTMQAESHQIAAHTNLRPVLGNQLVFYNKKRKYRIRNRNMCDWEL